MSGPPPAETSQTEYSRWRSPALTQRAFAGRAVTRRGLDAQPAAKTQLTLDVLKQINASIPVYNVMEFLNAQWGKMRILINAGKNMKKMMKRMAGTKYPHMQHSVAREKFILTWKHLQQPVMETLSVMKIKMKNFAINHQL